MVIHKLIGKESLFFWREKRGEVPSQITVCITNESHTSIQWPPRWVVRREASLRDPQMLVWMLTQQRELCGKRLISMT